MDGNVNAEISVYLEETNDAYTGNEPWSKYIALVNKASNRNNTMSFNKGIHGGQWSLCTHLVKYGTNLDRGLAMFLTSVLRPRSALEFGCGIGLYINYMQHFSTAVNKTSLRFIGIEPENMIEASVFGKAPYKALQLVMNIFEMEQNILDSLGTFDVVFSSEVAEHIPSKFLDAMCDFLVAKTERFLVFGAAKPGQGGIGHLSEYEKQWWIEQFEKRGMIYLKEMSQKLSDVAFYGNRKRNTFVMTTKLYFQTFGMEKLNSIYLKNDVRNIFPDAYSKYTHLKEEGICNDA